MVLGFHGLGLTVSRGCHQQNHLLGKDPDGNKETLSSTIYPYWENLNLEPFISILG